MDAFLLVLGVRGVLGRSGGLPGASWDGGKEEEKRGKGGRKWLNLVEPSIIQYDETKITTNQTTNIFQR